MGRPSTGPQAGRRRTPPARLEGAHRADWRKAPTPWGVGVRVATLVLKPLLAVFTRPTWIGLDQVPRAGGVILAVNHVSVADPVVVADFCNYGAGRTPSFLAKASLFRLPVVGSVLAAARQIPVYRDRPDGGGALSAAVAALASGACVCIYPEGTVTRDPDGWPMQARTGVARLALESGAPVIPVGQWGAQDFVVAGRVWRSRPWPRTRVTVIAGGPVELSVWRGEPHTVEVLRAATDAVMAAVTALVAQARGVEAPRAAGELT